MTFKKIITSLLTVVVMTVGTKETIWAGNTSSKYYSPVNTAGTWWSGYSENCICSLKASYTNVYDGEIGMTFYRISNVGMPSTFVQSTDRRVIIELKEDDAGDNANESIRFYYGKFEVVDGYYTVNGYYDTGSSGQLIESNNVVELYIRFKVNTCSGDTSKNVPKKIFGYEMWVR